jgi:tetratricopeptide (TPR) repeat protein
MRKAVLIAIALLLLATAALPSDAAVSDQARFKKSTAAFDKGVKAAKAGELEEAETLFHQALEHYPLPGAYVELGKIQMSRNKPDKALEYYQQAREAFLKLRDEKVKGQAAAQNQNREYAQQDQMSSKPTTGGFAKVSVEKDKSQRTEDNRQVVAPEQEADIPALFYLYISGAYLKLGKPDLAEKELLEGIARDAKMAPLQFNLAVACMMQGKYPEAAEAARKAKDLGFQLPPAFVTDLESRGQLKI